MRSQLLASAAMPNPPTVLMCSMVDARREVLIARVVAYAGERVSFTWGDRQCSVGQPITYEYKRPWLGVQWA